MAKHIQSSTGQAKFERSNSKIKGAVTRDLERLDSECLLPGPSVGTGSDDGSAAMGQDSLVQNRIPGINTK